MTGRTLEEELGGPTAGRLLDDMVRRIRAARGILVTSHVQPDGDALGSEIGLALGLRKLGRPVRVVNDHPPPAKYRFLDPAGLVQTPPDPAAPGPWEGIDLAILLDASDPARAGRLEGRLLAPGLARLCLDHHPGPPDPRFAGHWVAERAPATGCLVLRLLDALGVAPDRPIAEALFTAIATDTGWFRYSNTSPLALRDAARLIEAGVEPEPLHARIYEDSSPERLVLLGRLLSGLRVEMGGRFVWSLLDRAALDSSGVPGEEMDGFSETLKAVSGAEVVAAVVEQVPGVYKVSLRARGDVAVNAIAAGFSGGGHRKAAGFRATGDLQGILERLRAKVEPALAAARSVADPSAPG